MENGRCVPVIDSSGCPGQVPVPAVHHLTL